MFRTEVDGWYATEGTIIEVVEGSALRLRHLKSDSKVLCGGSRGSLRFREGQDVWSKMKEAFRFAVDDQLRSITFEPQVKGRGQQVVCALNDISGHNRENRI